MNRQCVFIYRMKHYISTLNSYIKNHVNLVSTLVVICSASLFYIYCGIYGADKNISDYTLLSTVLFLGLHAFSIGVDQFIISENTKVISGKSLVLGIYILYPLLIITATLFFLCTFGYLIDDKYLDLVGLKRLAELNRCATYCLLAITLIFGIYAKILAAIMLRLNNENKSNYLFVGKALGFIIGALIASVMSLDAWIIIIPLITEMTPFLLLSIAAFGCFKIKFESKFNYKYVFSGLNVFSFDAIMKMDLILLALFGQKDYLAVYSIISSVFEAYIQLINSYRYKFASMVYGGLSLKKLLDLYKINSVMIIFFLPSFLIFNLITVNNINSSVLISSLILQMTLFLSIPGVLTFHYQEIIGAPLTLTLISILCIAANISIGIMLIDSYSIIGVSVATLVSYFLLSLTNIYLIRKRL